MLNSKDSVLEFLENLTREQGVCEASPFQASGVAEELHISRSLASQYMNALYCDGSLVKVSSRPARYYGRKAIEQAYSIRLTETMFLSTSELLAYINKLRLRRYDFSDVVGANGSCKRIVESIRAASSYPPKGLPLLLVGPHGSGKTALRNASARWCVSKGIVADESAVKLIDVAASSVEELSALLFDEREGLLRSDSNNLVWLLNCQELGASGWRMVLSYFDEASPAGKSRLFFEYVGTEAQVRENPLLQQIPFVCAVPEFSKREYREREALVYRSFKEESRRIGRTIKISSSVARRLATRQYPDNINGLVRTVRLACANAIADAVQDETGALLTYSSHVPLLESEAGSYELLVDPVFVDVEQFDPYADSREGLALLSAFLEVFSQNVVGGGTGSEAKTKSELSRFLEYVAHNQKTDGQVKSSEAAVVEIIRQTFDRCGSNEPVNFSNHLINCLSFSRANRAAVVEWEEENRALLSACKVMARRQCGSQFETVSQLGRTLRDGLGWEMDDGCHVILTSYLHWYAGERMTSCRGIIVAHGYSTASSIADSVNTMLGNHVFDAVDVPLEVPTDEVIEALRRHLQRSDFESDLLIMVDMGSLEVIGENLNLAFNADIGVINNVSTASALEAGAAMLQHLPLQDILQRVQENTHVGYSVCSKRVVRDCIVFVSENGMAAASRIAQLFVKSLPCSLDVDIVTGDYFEMLETGKLPDDYADRNVLFVFGASDPHVEGVRFVSLEDVVGYTPDEDMSINLEGHLTPDQVDAFKKNLIKNFSLENLMGHLTVLEPTRLMNAVSHSIESLQAGLQVHFPYKTIMRLYIHTSYLVERLVTKVALECADSQKFESENPRFVSLVRASFENVTRDYGVDLPIGEISYLFDLIQLEVENLDEA